MEGSSGFAPMMLYKVGLTSAEVDEGWRDGVRVGDMACAGCRNGDELREAKLGICDWPGGAGNNLSNSAREKVDDRISSELDV